MRVCASALLLLSLSAHFSSGVTNGPVSILGPALPIKLIQHFSLLQNHLTFSAHIPEDDRYSRRRASLSPPPSISSTSTMATLDRTAAVGTRTPTPTAPGPYAPCTPAGQPSSPQSLPFHCPLDACGHRLSSFNGLKRHINTKHIDDAPGLLPLADAQKKNRSQEPTQCGMCGKTFTSRRGCLQHQRKQHLDQYKVKVTMCTSKKWPRRSYMYALLYCCLSRHVVLFLLCFVPFLVLACLLPSCIACFLSP